MTVCDGVGGRQSPTVGWPENDWKKGDHLLRMVESQAMNAAKTTVDTGLKSSVKWRGVDLSSRHRMRLPSDEKGPQSNNGGKNWENKIALSLANLAVLTRVMSPCQ